MHVLSEKWGRMMLDKGKEGISRANYYLHNHCTTYPIKPTPFILTS